MIDADKIRTLIENEFSMKGIFLVDIQVKPSGKICVFADTLQGITLEECAQISRHVQQNLGGDLEDFELEVSSPGVDNPLRLPVQYRKNIGRIIRVLSLEGETTEGKIAGADDEKVRIEMQVNARQPGKKKAGHVEQVELFYSQIKKAKIIIR
jgi:ribosome maturation factor RimP